MKSRYLTIDELLWGIWPGSFVACFKSSLWPDHRITDVSFGPFPYAALVINVTQDQFSCGVTMSALKRGRKLRRELWNRQVWTMKCGTNLILVFLIVFFRPQLSISPKLFADRLIETRYPHSWYVDGEFSGAKTSIAGDLLAEYRKQSIQLGPCSGSFAVGHLFFVLVFFSGHLFDIVWRIFLKDFCHDCEVIPFSELVLVWEKICLTWGE